MNIHKKRKKWKKTIREMRNGETGITLIALVVTIVVLLILAGITIQLVLSDGGIFNQVQKSKEQTRIGELLDKFNVSEASVSLEKFGKPSLADFINQVQNKEGYVIDAKEQEEGNYQVTSEDGYVFTVSIIEGSNTNDIVIDYIGKVGNLPPKMKVKNITTNSAEIEIIRTEGITSYKYEYKKHNESTYQLATGNNNTCALTNLTNNTIYDVKVTVIKEGKEIVLEKQIAVGQIPTGGTIKLRSVTWASGKATAVVYHEETESYKIEWQKTGGTTWNAGGMGVKEISIPNLSHNDTILLRLNDGTSSGDEASMSVIDDKEPQIAIISFNPTTAKAGDNIVARVTMIDNESSINNSSSRYEFNKTSTPLGTEDVSLYTKTFANTRTPTIQAISSGTWYLHVLSVDNAGNKLETVSSGIIIMPGEIADLDRSQGDIEIIFVDMENNPIDANSVPTPKLGTGMTPIKWNGSIVTTTTTSDSEWYDYSKKQWANAQTSDGSMWVWVPRYSYKILYKNANGTVIGYSDSDGIIDINGNSVTGTKKKGAIEVKGNADGKEISKYVLHPAFQKFDTLELTMANGGWKEDVPGIWVAKFEASSVQGNSNEMSGDNVTTKTIQVKPGVKSWGYITVNNVFTNCENYNKTLNSHLMKNSEWGAVAYLAKSKYGKNEKITINGNSYGWTGGGSANDYVTNVNQKQSTTGNVYGIYDMSGGGTEFVASYIDNGLQGDYGGENVVNASAHLKQVYKAENNDESQQNYQVSKDKYGDAVYETSTSGNDTKSWYQEGSYFPFGVHLSFGRGGNYSNGYTAGAFSYNYFTATEVYHSFRPVLIVP